MSVRATRQAARYRLDRLIGAGGSATVWRAAVAVKRLPPGSSPQLVAGLREQASILARLDHPNVVRVVEVVEGGAGPAVVLEHAAGGSLADLLRERGSLDSGEIVALAAPLAGALAAAHEAGIVHGDVAPGNVLLATDGRPMLADFGGGQSGSGTRPFVAPEVLAGSPPSAAADVFALAALCGAACPRPSAALAEVLANAQSVDPQARGTAAAFASALLASVPPADVRLPRPAAIALPGDGPITRPFGPAPSLDRPPPEPVPDRRRVVAIATTSVAVILALAATGTVVGASGHGRQRCDGVGAVAGLPAGAQLVRGDPDGDGCDTVAAYASHILQVVVAPGEHPRRYALGQSGDRLLLGDWDCDGADTPAIYRPATGAVIYFDSWGSADAPAPPTAYGAAAPGGTPAVEPTPGGCDDVRVSPSPPGG